MSIRDLAQGMSGEDVRAVQQGLNQYFGSTRPPLSASGYFDAATHEAVVAFQRANPSTGRADGIVGRRTRRRLFPLAVVSVSAFGYRLVMPSTSTRRGIQPPNLGPGPLHWPGDPGAQQQPGLTLNPYANVLHVDWSQLTRPMRVDFRPQHFPGLRLPIATPPVPLLPRPQLSTVPALTLPGSGSGASPSSPPSTGPLLSFAHVHHFELSPGAQVMLANPSQTSFTLGLQGVAMIGDENAAHQEYAMGTQIGTPTADGSGDWSFSWYAQITDVDRFGSLGLFHWWQPYAQIGIQSSPGSFRPLLTGAAFPVNLGFDINKVLTVSVAGGVALTYDPQTGAVQAGLQGTAGLILKFDLPARTRQ